MSDDLVARLRALGGWPSFDDPDQVLAYVVAADEAGAEAANRIEELTAERDELEADVLTAWRVRNAALATAASFVHPGPDHADYTIRQKMVEEWVAEGHEQVTAENHERTEMLQRLIKAEAELDELRAERDTLAEMVRLFDPSIEFTTEVPAPGWWMSTKAGRVEVARVITPAQAERFRAVLDRITKEAPDE